MEKTIEGYKRNFQVKGITRNIQLNSKKVVCEFCTNVMHYRQPLFPLFFKLKKKELYSFCTSNLLNLRIH